MPTAGGRGIGGHIVSRCWAFCSPSLRLSFGLRKAGAYRVSDERARIKRPNHTLILDYTHAHTLLLRSAGWVVSVVAIFPFRAGGGSSVDGRSVVGGRRRRTVFGCVDVAPLADGNQNRPAAKVARHSRSTSNRPTTTRHL